MAESNKRLKPLGARLNDSESVRWRRVMEIVKSRNALADDSKVLRDILFGDLGIVTEDDRRLLRDPEIGRIPVPYLKDAANEDNMSHEKKAAGKGQRRSPNKSASRAG